ncbi:MAG: chloride channel protein [Paenibacillus sp.]|nr:chloride channel protein [Paenibacillus sp.]
MSSQNTPPTQDSSTPKAPAVEPPFVTAQKEWRLGSLPPSVSLYVLASLVGLITGGCAFILKSTIKWLSILLVSHFKADDINWTLLVIPLVGIVLTVALQRYGFKRNIEHGLSKIGEMVKGKQYDIPATYTYGPIMASTLTLGFGGSAGAEGPIASAGAALASQMGRWVGLPPRLMMIIIGCGAGAGIAGIFKAPVGGMMFTLEVMGMQMSTVSVIALTIACVIGGMTSYGMTEFTLDVPLSHPQYFDPHMSGWVIVIGVMCGLYSLYYSYMGGLTGKLFSRIRSPWLKALASGGILSVLVFLFPSLYGEGYSTMAHLIDGSYNVMTDFSLWHTGGAPSLETIVLVCGGVAAVKGIACTATNSGGGVAGDFAPTLFAGCMAGFFFGALLNTLLGLSLPLGNCALIAMAGTMAGIIKAPLMAMFIVVEMTGYYGMMFPVAICSVISYATVWCLTEKKLPEEDQLI